MPDYIEEYLCQIKDNRDINQWDTLYTHLYVKEPILRSVRLQDERGGRDELGRSEPDVKDVVAQEKRLIISGASGMGKTTTLKWLTLVYAENYLEGAERLVPLYVDLGRFRHGRFYDPALMIAHENRLEEEDFKELLDGGKLVIFLDGLDLLGGLGDFEPAIEIRNFMSTFSRCKFVLSARPGFFEGFKSGCKVYELVELDDPKIKGYIHKYLGDGDSADTLIRRIFDHRNERLKSLCRNPMMLYLVIWLQKDGRMVDDRAGIYRESVEGIITHYKEKGKTLPSNEQHVRDVLKELAFPMQKENVVRLDYGSAMDVAGSCTSPKRYMGVSAEQILEDCFKLGLLHKDDDEVRFGFHQSFQEYFAAVKLKEIFEYGYDISESFFHPKWEDTLIFLSEITEHPDELFDDVIDAGEVSLAAKLTAHVEARRVENLCALLLDKVDSEFEMESDMAVESFAYIGDRAIGALIGLLVKPDVRFEVANALGIIGGETAVKSLIAALQSDDSLVRKEAAWALGRIGSGRAVEPLIDALRDGDSDVRGNAASALGEIGGERAVERLIAAALYDDEQPVRSCAAWALGRIGSGRAVGSLIAALHYADEQPVRSCAASALGRIGSERAVGSLIAALYDADDIWAQFGVARALGRTGSERAVEPLIAALQSDNSSVRSCAAWALGRIGSERAVEPLIAALQSDDSSVRSDAARALGRTGSERAVEPLIDVLYDDDFWVRSCAAWALGEIGGERAVEPLIDALQSDDDSSVRSDAAWALGRIGCERAVEPLIDALRDGDSDVRGNAAWALGEIGGERAVEPLIDALRDGDSDVRGNAAWALESLCGPIHKEKLKLLLKSDGRDVASEAFEILHSIELKEREKIKIFKELKYLLIWGRIPGNDSDRLLKYLLNNHDVTWAERAKLHKSDDKTLIISKDKNSAEIKIDERGEKATLKLSDGRTCDLNVRTKKAKSGYTTPSGVMGAEEMFADAHLGALIDRLKLVPNGITIVDYGCGKGALLGRMKEIERELGKIHYIGVDISRGNRYLAGITAKRCGVADKLKSYDFMKPDEFFNKDIDIDHVFFSHVIHEIFLKDLPEILYHLLSKMKAGSRITILEQMMLVEPERDFVTWDADDFDMLFSGFAESSPRPYQTGRGHELISVDLERLNTDVSLESIRKRCLEVYEHKKERALEKLRSHDLSDDEHRYQTALLANIYSQMNEYQKSMNG